MCFFYQLIYLIILFIKVLCLKNNSLIMDHAMIPTYDISHFRPGILAFRMASHSLGSVRHIQPRSMRRVVSYVLHSNLVLRRRDTAFKLLY